MPLGSALNSLLLLAKNLDTKNPTEMPVKKSDSDKPVVFPYGKEINYLPRDIPENHGYTKEYLESYFNELVSDFSVKPNRLLILKDDKVIAERYEPPYVKDSWDCVFSSSKTLVALAIGFLYDEKKIELDTPAYKYIGNEKKIGNLKNKKITVRHLLTMSTGNSFNEMETASSHKWVKSYFDSNLKFKVGTKFEYNSLNTYILSVIVEKVAKEKFATFVRKRLFDPLGINDTHLDTSPEGYFKGGWGLYILPDDMARLGLLVKNNGVYEGKRILSEEWINLMSHKQFDATKFKHTLNYGFQMWVDEANDMCAFNGMYDQDIFVYRRSGVVVVTCCADNEVFHTSNLFKITAKYFANEKMGEFPLCPYRANRDLHNEESLMYYYDLIANKDYKPVSKLSNSCGILPVILQNELGTYSKGVKGVYFKKEGTSYALIVQEGHDKYEIAFDFDNGIRQIFKIYENVFDCVCSARFILSGKNEPLLIIRLFFLEFSSSRYFSIRFTKDPDMVSLELSENPGFDFVMSLIEIQDESTKDFLFNLTKTIGHDYINGKIKNIFSPSFSLVHGESKIKKLLRIKDKKPVKKIETKKKEA